MKNEFGRIFGGKRHSETLHRVRDFRSDMCFGKGDKRISNLKNDKQLDHLLRSLGRNPQQIEAIKDFGRLSKTLTSSNDLDALLIELRKKWNR